ncbi:1427_t:CDS:2 [Racocetra fulgida]|uniref:1427_t:CDS:1 n=1 Tax=Racocetra fulgida TaxID=60492 RepID=A0A9N8WAL1_9GLOM|nr:1427_t:CDS:2 [Racocetra fulgida]
MDYQRQLLEELMAPYESSAKHNFWDDSEAPERGKYGYEIKFYDYLQSLCNDLDKKIRKGNDRLNVRPDDTLLNPNKDEKEERMIILDIKIKELLTKIEEAGEEGRVQEAQTLTKEVETLQKDLDFLKNSDDSNPLFKQERRMLVCEVCGAFLVTNDTSNRMDAHLQGKQHTGYKQIRETLHEWKQSRSHSSRDSSRDHRRDSYVRHEPYPRNRREKYREYRRDERDYPERDYDDYSRRRNGKDYRRDRDDRGRRYYDD